MNKALIISILIMVSGTLFSAPKVILKLDDIGVKSGKLSCAPTLDYLISQQLKSAIGIIAERNDKTALSTLSPYLTAKNSKGESLIELWNHGLDHCRTEFKDSSYLFQKRHFEQANQIVLDLLGVQMHTFGTPFNASDSTTNRVVSENKNYKVFLYSSIKSKQKNGILYLDHRVNMENGTGKPEYAYFLENYTKFKNKYTDYIILQGHPNLWDNDRLVQFQQIIEQLKSDGCEFVLSYEYALSLSNK